MWSVLVLESHSVLQTDSWCLYLILPLLDLYLLLLNKLAVLSLSSDVSSTTLWQSVSPVILEILSFLDTDHHIPTPPTKEHIP